MTRAAVGYTLAAVAVALAVLGGGVGIAGAESLAAVAWGTGAALAVQVAVFWVLFVWVLPSQHGLAHGLGAVVRFGAVAAMALVSIGASSLPAAPLLFSMVACLFVTTLLEPLFLRRRGAAGAPARSATMRTQN